MNAHNVGTADAINDHKTAHKHSSLAPFRHMTIQKAFSFSGEGVRQLTLHLDPSGGTSPRPPL